MKRILWTAAVAVTLGVSARAMAKPPDLPANTDHTATPQVVPDDREVPTPEVGNTLPSGEFLCHPPMMAHLPAVQRRQFATAMLLGVHPLLVLVPTDKLVDMPCDHPMCYDSACGRGIEVNFQDLQALLVKMGIDGKTGMKCEVVPMLTDIHGSIEIGIGFNLNGAPTFKCEVIQFRACGNGCKEQSIWSRWESYIGSMMRNAAEGQPAAKDDASFTCPYLLHKEKPAGECGSPYAHFPSVLENLEKLAKEQELREKVRRDHEVDEPAYEEEEEPDHVCIPGVQVMVDGLLKGCHQALSTGRFEHAADLAQQAHALDPQRVQADSVVYHLHLLANAPQSAGCCGGCASCPLCQTARKPATIILNVTPMLPRVIVDPKTIDALDDVLRGAEVEEQEEHIFQKALGKPYRETNDAPPAVNKGE